MFVLQNGVLKYYKVSIFPLALQLLSSVVDFICIPAMQIFGMHGISLSHLLDHLRKEAEVITIGTETGVLENKRYCSFDTTAMHLI